MLYLPAPKLQIVWSNPTKKPALPFIKKKVFDATDEARYQILRQSDDLFFGWEAEQPVYLDVYRNVS